MILTLLLLTIFVWLVVYWLEGHHDAQICFIQTNSVDELVKLSDDKVASNTIRARIHSIYSTRWHTLDAYMFIVLKLSYGVLCYLITGNIWQSILLVLVTLGCRMTHDIWINYYWNKPIIRRPHCGGTWDFWDCLMGKLYDINKFIPMIVRIIIFILPIVTYWCLYL